MLHETIRRFYPNGCRVLATRPLGRAASLFVLDTDFRAHPTRILGTLADNTVLEHSAMDLMTPERLVYLYERAMLVAFSLVARPRKALLLGLGGGEMWRHLQAYLPDCEVTVIEREKAVIEFARRHFFVTDTDSITCADAEEAVADLRGGYDVLLFDCYDADGLVPLPPRFWRDCLAALRPGGAIAINWAGFLEKKQVRDEIAAVCRELSPSFFLAGRGPRANMIQLVPQDPDFSLAGLPERWRRFCLAHRLPREDRAVLQRNETFARFPPRR